MAKKVRKLSPTTPWKGNSSEEVVTLGSTVGKVHSPGICSFLLDTQTQMPAGLAAGPGPG